MSVDLKEKAATPETSVGSEAVFFGATSATAVSPAVFTRSALVALMAAAAPVTSVAGRTGAITLAKADVGLGSVDNTADASKPVSAAQASAIATAKAEAIAAAPVQSVAGRTGAVVLTSTDVGLANVNNTSDASKPISTATQTALDAKADLVGGKVPSSQLPAFVDDVLEYANTAAFPATGSAGIIYVALDTNKTYRWGGSSYTEISPSPGSTDAVPEGATNLYHTSSRVNALISATVGSVVQGYNTGLAAIAALTTTSYGRSVLTWADAAAGRSALALGTAAQSNTTAFDAAGSSATAQANAVQRANHTGTQAPATITFAATARLLGRSTAGAGTGEEISIGSGLALSGGVLSNTATSGTPGGAAGTVQYQTSGGAFGGMTGTSWDDTNRALTITGATVTTSVPIINFSQTWNNSATTFVLDSMNVTDTASAAASLLIERKVGNAHRFSVTKAGQVRATHVNVNTPMFTSSNDTTCGWSNDGFFNIQVGGANVASMRSNDFWIKLDAGQLFIGNSNQAALGRAALRVLSFEGVGGAVGGTFRTLPTRPAQITADQNNYAPGGNSLLQLWSSDASRTVTGLSVSQVDGEQHEIWNTGSNPIVLANESASSTAANRFQTTTGADITLSAKQMAFLRYDATQTRWLVTKGN